MFDVADHTAERSYDSSPWAQVAAIGSASTTATPVSSFDSWLSSGTRATVDPLDQLFSQWSGKIDPDS